MSAPRLPRGFADGLAPPLFFFSLGPPDSPNFLSLNLSFPLAGVGVLGLWSRMTRTATDFPRRSAGSCPYLWRSRPVNDKTTTPPQQAETKWLMLCSNA